MSTIRQILEIKSFLSKHPIIISRFCNNQKTGRTIYNYITEMFKHIKAGNKFIIECVKFHMPIMLAFECVTDLKIYAIIKYNIFVDENKRLPDRGQLVIDGFWDLFKLKTIRYTPRLIGNTRIFGVFSKERGIEAAKLYVENVSYYKLNLHQRKKTNIEDRVLVLKSYLNTDPLLLNANNRSKNTLEYILNMTLMNLRKGNTDCINAIRRHIPIMAKLKTLGDIRVYLLNQINNFVAENCRFPKEGELVIDGFWDLHEICGLSKIRGSVLNGNQQYILSSRDEAKRVLYQFELYQEHLLNVDWLNSGPVLESADSEMLAKMDIISRLYELKFAEQI